MNPTDFLIGIVIALGGTIAALVAYVFIDHKTRVDRMFSENADQHKDINDNLVGVRDRVIHIISHHEGIPPFSDED